MEDCINLLRPKFLGFKNRLGRSFRKSPLKLLIMASMIIGFWAVIFFLFQRVLLYLRSIGPVGDIFNAGLFAMLLMIFFGILFFSNLITSLSTFFLSEDLSLILFRPVSRAAFYCARLVETILYSSWMVLFFCVPILGAYGWVYRESASLGFYAALPAAFIPFFIIPAALGILVTMILVNVFPARSTKDVLILLPLLCAAGLYFLWRFMKPEIPADPFSASGLVEYFKTWRGASSRPFLPSHWVSEFLMPFLKNTPAATSVFWGGLWLAAVAAVAAGGAVSRMLFFRGWTRSQEARRVYLSRSHLFARFLEIVSRPLPPQLRALAVKDVRIFFRDPLQWSQLILLTVLVVVYLSSFAVVTFHKTPNFFIKNLLSFMNIGMAGFVLTAISGRFAFTSVSQEGFSFWIIRSCPVSLRTFLWNKFWTNLIPLLLLAEGIIFITNGFLKATPFMMILSLGTMCVLTFGIVGLAVGVGAIYPRFKTETPSRMAIGLSGTLYMILSMLFVGAVVSLEYWAVYRILTGHYHQQPFSIFQWAGVLSAFCGAIFLIGMAIFLPMRIGLKKLSEMDF